MGKPNFCDKKQMCFPLQFCLILPEINHFFKNKNKIPAGDLFGGKFAEFFLSCSAGKAHLGISRNDNVFGRQRKIPSGGVIFWVFYLVGATLWGWLLTECPTEMQSCTDVFGNAAVVIKHFAFPALLMPFEDGLLKKCRQTTIFCFFLGQHTENSMFTAKYTRNVAESCPWDCPYPSKAQQHERCLQIHFPWKQVRKPSLYFFA